MINDIYNFVYIFKYGLIFFNFYGNCLVFLRRNIRVVKLWYDLYIGIMLFFLIMLYERIVIRVYG